MFFSFGRPEKDRVATRFMGRVHAALVQAAVRRKRDDGLTQRALAERLGMDKGSLSRLLSGRGNPTLRTLGEVAWALDLEPIIEFRDRSAGRNDVTVPATSASVPPATSLVGARASEGVRPQSSSPEPLSSWSSTGIRSV